MALHYELEVLDDLIFEDLHPKNFITTLPEEKKLKEWNDLLVAEKSTIQKKIRKTVGSFIKENRKESYIQLQQSGITRLQDAVLHFLLPKDVSSLTKKSKTLCLENLYKEIWLELDLLLQQLKNDYAKHFDFNAKIADGCKWKNEAIIRDALAVIKKSLSKKVSSSLLELLCEPFEHFLKLDNECSYRELAYLQELQVFLLAISEQAPDNIKNLITDRLLYLNFNSVLFFNYSILNMSDEAARKKTVTERVEYFSWQIKVINQTPVQPNIVYLRHLPPIRDQLVFWIVEDLYYLDKKHQLSLALPVNRETEKDKLKKVHVQLTVSDLALGARLLLDTDIIVDMNYTELMKIVAKGFRTNRQASISQQAIYNVGFEPSVTSKEKVKHVLMKMVRKIGEY